MEQYEEWQDEGGNIIRKCPVHNYYASPNVYQPNYQQERMISPNYEKIYISPRQIEQYNDYIITSNQNMINDYDYPQYSYENNQNINYSNQYYNQGNNNDIYNINGTNSSTNNLNSSLSKYESSDGVLRGYTNNYSFYVSGSSQIKPKVTINNQYNNNYRVNNSNNSTNYQNKNSTPIKRQIIYNNTRQMPRNIGQYQKIIYSNNDTNINNNFYNRNYENRQIIHHDNSSYIIRTVENEPVKYTPPNMQYTNNYNMSHGNNDEDDEIYYINENRNISQQRNYQKPIIQRRVVKRVVDREPSDSRKDYYILGPNDNQRNINTKNKINNNYQQKTIYQKVNNENLNNNLKKYSNNNGRTTNINQRNDYFSPYPLKRTNTPNIQRPNLTSNTNYTRPIISRQQKIMGRSPNFYGPKNLNNNESYPSRGNIYAYTDNNNNFYNQTEINSPRTRTPYLTRSPLMEQENNVYIYPTRREREYTSKTELQNQPGYEYEYEENDEDDDVYEVPEQFNDNRVVYYEDSRQNVTDRPFLRVSNYSQSERNGRKYGVYTQTLAMNKNYNYDDEYEVDRRKVRNMRRYNKRNNYSVPKIMRPINDVQKLVRQNREYTTFERSLKNIRDNEEEIELENEERNNRVRIKTSGSNNHRLYISNNSRGHPSRKYKTYTELQSDRPQGYVLEDIDANSQDEYDMPPNINRNRKIIKKNNLRIVEQETDNRYQPPPPKYHPELENNYYDEENMDSYQNINTQTQNEENGDEVNDEEEHMYDSNQLITAKEDNFRIVQNNERNRREDFNRKQIIQNSQNSDENEQMQDNEAEGEEHEEDIIQQTNTNIEEDSYRREDSPKDGEENIPTGDKNIKNIQTEINEKYYDNQGNYLGEKKIITTKQVPVNNQNNQREDYNPQREEGDYQDDQEEQEDDNENDNEYTPYQSNHKKFQKRGENNKNIIESKYHSYFGDSNNNVYYEIKGVSGEVNKEGESKNDEEIERRNYKEPMVQVKNVTFGIQSENLCVQGQDNDNNNIEEKDNIDDKGNNDEKEADEQQIDENAAIDEEEEEEQNNINQNKENEENLEKNQNLNEEQIINEDNKENDNENEQIHSNKDIFENNNINQDNYTDENNNEKNMNENIYSKHEENENNNKYTDNIIDEQANINENNIEENLDSNNNIEDVNIENKENNNNNAENELNNRINNNNDIQYEENNINMNDQNNINENNESYKDNDNTKRNNYAYNEVEQIVEENEEEIENQNIQKEEAEESIGEGLVDLEDNNDNYNYEENEMVEGEEGFEEQIEDNNVDDFEEENINKEENENEKEN